MNVIKLRNFASRLFLRAEGGFAVKFALLIPCVLISVGAAVDISRMVHAKTLMQDAADAAVIMAAREKTFDNENWQRSGKRAFKDQASQLQLKRKPKVSLEDNNDGTVIIQASGNLKPHFMQIFGYPKLKVSVRSVVGVGAPPPEKMEIVLVLDFSDSMESNSKVDRLKSTVNVFLDELQAMQNAGADIKVGIVPFAGMVSGTFSRSSIVSTPLFPDMDGNNGDSTWTGCTGDRHYPANTSFVPPTDDDSKWGLNADGNYQDVKDSCVNHGYAAKNLVIQPPTSNINNLRTELNSMTPTYNTHIALGLSMGGHLLTPDEPFSGAARFTDTSTQKVLVLLTDGAQTRNVFGPDDYQYFNGSNHMVSLCTELKEKNVRIATIAYDLSGNASISGDELNNIQNCASDPSLSFLPDASLQSLSAAFDGIVSNGLNMGTFSGELRILR